MLALPKCVLVWTAAFCLLPAAIAAPPPAGVGNFRQVNEHVYRGAQPTVQGFGNLAKLGVATVLDLREPGQRSADEKRIVQAAGMRYVSIPLKGLSAPSMTDITKALSLLEDQSAGPVFVHCRRGADRTGTIVACYRIAHDGWQPAKALREAKGLGMAWYTSGMQHFISSFTPPVQNASAVDSIAAN